MPFAWFRDGYTALDKYNIAPKKSWTKFLTLFVQLNEVQTSSQVAQHKPS